jgi:hypothetical protein
VELPPGLKLLNLNDRLHWAKRHELYEQLKSDALKMIRLARVPQLERVGVTVVYDPPPDWRDHDPDNVAASAKPIIDAMRPPGPRRVGGRIIRFGREGYVLAGDDSGHVAWVTCMIGDPFPRGRLRVVITELRPAGDA